MEAILKIKLVPSLQHITAAQICIAHYNREELVIEFLISQIGGRTFGQVRWDVQKDLVRRSISSLNFPKSLKAIILIFIDDIGKELLNWVRVNDWLKRRPEAVSNYIKNFLVWTSRGTIEYEKTARNIVRNECLTHVEKFHLACAYCFSDILCHTFVSDLKECTSSDILKLRKKPFVLYWVCRFFPEMTPAFKQNEDEVVQNCNIDKIMLLRFYNRMNCVAAKYLYYRIDLIAKEEVIQRLLLPAFDFDMKTHLISLISFGTREEIIRRPRTLLSCVTNVLWQDYVYFCFNTYEAFITSRECLKFLGEVVQSLFPMHKYPYIEINVGAPQCEWKKNFVHELWNCLSENFRQNVVTECLSQVTGGNRYRSLIFQILSFLGDFNKDEDSPYYQRSGNLIGEILKIAENETTNLEVSNRVPSYLNHFNTDDRMFGSMLYYPRKNHPIHLNHTGILRNKKLWLIHGLISLKFSNKWNPLKNERLHDTITDVFVEYCRSGEVKNIDELLNSHFENPPERVAYKSSLLWCMFNKLLVKAINESNYYMKDKSDDSHPTNVASQRIPPYIPRPEGRAAVRYFYGTEQVGHRYIPVIDPSVRTLVTRYIPVFEVSARTPVTRNIPVIDDSARTPVIYNSDDSEMIFTAIDSFLGWYFDTKEEVCEFKIGGLSSGNVPIIEELLKQNKLFKLRKLLRWFLLNEEGRINAFKNQCPRSELTSLF